MVHAVARWLGQSAAVALAVLVAASPTAAEEARQLRIVKQPGLAYLQLIVTGE